MEESRPLPTPSILSLPRQKQADLLRAAWFTLAVPGQTGLYNRDPESKRLVNYSTMLIFIIIAFTHLRGDWYGRRYEGGIWSIWGLITW